MRLLACFDRLYIHQVAGETRPYFSSKALCLPERRVGGEKPLISLLPSSVLYMARERGNCSNNNPKLVVLKGRDQSISSSCSAFLLSEGERRGSSISASSASSFISSHFSCIDVCARLREWLAKEYIPHFRQSVRRRWMRMMGLTPDGKPRIQYRGPQPQPQTEP